MKAGGRSGAALLAVAAALSCGGERPVPPGDVLLVVLDTVRADHVSSYGYPRETTPNLDRLAAEGERFDEAWAQSPWTLPAMATILTGLPPHRHGAGWSAGSLFGIVPDARTLAARLSAAGYRTAAFVNVVWCSPELSSLDRGFGRYDFRTSDETNRGHRDARETTDAATSWLRELGDEPFFLVVHYFDPHLTYDPPEPYDTMFEPDAGPRVPRGFGSATEVFRLRDGRIQLDRRRRESLIARYDGELRHTDEQFGRLREELERIGRWDETLVVVVSDHGEEFWDHGGFAHGHSHHRELLRVPLILRRPGGPAAVVRGGRVRQLDIAPTVLDFAGVGGGEELPGVVLGREGSTHSLAEGTLWAGDLVSVRSDRSTLILDRATGKMRLYGADDRLEHRPLPVDPDAQADLIELLRGLPPPQRRDDPARKLTEEQLERLRSLGYVR
jgi:arylsulfatase A-like enzyme